MIQTATMTLTCKRITDLHDGRLVRLGRVGESETTDLLATGTKEETEMFQLWQEYNISITPAKPTPALTLDEIKASATGML